MAEQDYAQGDYLTRPALGMRNARILSGRGIFAPGYRKVGEGKAAPSENLQDVRIVKAVDPLTGKGPATPGGGWRYYGRSTDVLDVKRVRVARSVGPNAFGTQKVVRP